jgi:outer membrane protein assembly factor BamB
MKKQNLSIGLILGILILFIPSHIYTQDWPQWRGVNRDGKVTGFNVLSEWPVELKQNWKVTVGFGDASPVLVNNKLYVFTREADNEVLRCLDSSTGKELWKNSYAAGTVSGPARTHPGPRSTPTVAEGKIVTLGVTGILSCLDANTGKVIWRKDEFTDGVPVYFAAMSPVIVDGMCITHLGGPENGKIIAFDLATGNIKWQWNGDGPSYASPVLMTTGSGKHVIVQTDRNLVALALSDGKPVWQIPTPNESRFYSSASPIINGQTVIYTGHGTGTRAVKILKQNNGFVTNELWSNRELGTAYNTPVLKEGFLYGLNDKGKLYCMNAQNGQTAWIDPLMHKNFGAILDAGTVMVTLPSTSELIVYKPDGKQYTELARIKVANTPVYAHPLLVGNRIYVKDNETLTMWTTD